MDQRSSPGELTWYERVYVPRGEKAENLCMASTRCQTLRILAVLESNLHLFLGELRGRFPPHRIHALLGYVELFLRV